MDRRDIITGNRIFEICAKHGIPYAKTDYMGEVPIPDDRQVLVTHNGGFNIRDAPGDHVAITSLGMAAFLQLPPALRWFCLNNESTRGMTEGIPLGVENWEIPDCGKGSSKHYTLGSQEHENAGLEVIEAIEEVWKNPPEKSMTAMMCWREDTAPYERGLARLQLEGLPWCKWYDGNIKSKARLSPRDFIHELASHAFVICPEGNGIDCHRVWEAMYVGTTPVVKRRWVWEHFATVFPIWIVDDWKEVARPLLDHWARSKMAGGAATPRGPIEALYAGYWEKRLCQVLAT